MAAAAGGERRLDEFINAVPASTGELSMHLVASQPPEGEFLELRVREQHDMSPLTTMQLAVSSVNCVLKVLNWQIDNIRVGILVCCRSIANRVHGQTLLQQSKRAAKIVATMSSSSKASPGDAGTARQTHSPGGLRGSLTSLDDRPRCADGLPPLRIDGGSPQPEISDPRLASARP
jgi:hypothetical protein